MPSTGRSCPCGDPTPFVEHCEPLLDGAPAPTAERLMRSRYVAYVLLQQGDGRAADHLWRTWHPRHRPDVVEPSPGLRWTGLTVHDATRGGADDSEGEVTFTACWETGEGGTRQVGELAERSGFARRGGRWVYVSGSPRPGTSP